MDDSQEGYDRYYGGEEKEDRGIEGQQHQNYYDGEEQVRHGEDREDHEIEQESFGKPQEAVLSGSDDRAREMEVNGMK